ncbi:hypothetical protein RF11_05296 [Thelohanellus kitauei]|uniref:Uncharacterized protein n=1 Tax=Thelohanellus kitauei TaxID=669202 RepID=A0A0C2IUA9_THEKT|nr:hypothetical protein RF11_05296 [Thelohanellus kitauei]
MEEWTPRPTIASRCMIFTEFNASIIDIFFPPDVGITGLGVSLTKTHPCDLSIWRNHTLVPLNKSFPFRFDSWIISKYSHRSGHFPRKVLHFEPPPDGGFIHGDA